VNRLFSLIIVSALIALPLALLLGAISLAKPSLLELTGWLVCPAGAQANVELIPQGGSNEYAIDMACVGDGVRIEDRATWAMAALGGMYWVGLTVLIFSGFIWRSIKPKPATPDVAPQVLIQQGVDAEVATLLAKGNKIAAIKRVRELTQMGLKESKEYVEAIQANPYTTPSLSGTPEATPHDPVQSLEQLKTMLDKG